MNNKDLSIVSASRRGFTLLELIVVIGIIGVLMTVAISQFGGATESAKRTKCQANLSNLAKAVIATAQRDEDGNFPAAGSFKWTDFTSGKTLYSERKGWISWNKAPGNTSKGGGATIPFTSGDEEMIRYAITNGAIWKAMNGARSCYQCQAHVAAFHKKTGRDPGWSYVMNQDFGYDSNYGSGPLPGWSGRNLNSDKGGATSADRRLLFAEIQGVDVEAHGLKAKHDAGGTDGDGVLQYSRNEVIGFNHKDGKDWVGHVAFADGHVQAIKYPRSGQSLTEVTKYFCQGHEVKFDGKRYEDLSK